MAKKQYNVITKARQARPRNRRNEVADGGGGSSVNVVVEGGGGSSTVDPNSHTHPNKALLDSLANDALGYLYMRFKEAGASESTLQKIKAGYADVAGTLSEDSPIWDTFLRKDKEDQTSYLISFLAGAIFGKDGFMPGLSGFGAKIDKFGNGEMESLILRRFLQVPELHFNRTEIIVGDRWRAAGGLIKKIVPDGGSSKGGQGWLRLEDGEYGQIAIGDICMGIFHSEDSSKNATADSDDSRGNFKFAGFFTSYFTITDIPAQDDQGKDNSDNHYFIYQIRPVDERWQLEYHPCESMKFVCYGTFNENHPERMNTEYSTRTYTRYLWRQNSWEITKANIAMQFGDLTNMESLGVTGVSGFSIYLDSVYFSGTFQQVKKDGTPIFTANDCGAWVATDDKGQPKHYDYYDRPSHNGRLWLCVNPDGTTSEPMDGNADWLLQVDKGADGEQGTNITHCGHWHTGLPVPYMGVVTMGGDAFVCINPNGTKNPPMYTFTDNSNPPRRLTTPQGGYLLTGVRNTIDYDLLVQSGSDGQPGKPGKPGQDGKDGKDHEWIFKQSTIETVFDTPDSKNQDDYVPEGWTDDSLGVSSVIKCEYSCERVKVNGVWGPWSKPALWNRYGEKGEDGQGYTQCGHWHTGLPVPYMGVVSMGGSSHVCINRNGTKNPPMYTFMDNSNPPRRLTTPQGGYLLTGEYNSTDYEILAHKGDKGEQGDTIKGDKGDKGDSIKGDTGPQGLQGCIVRVSKWQPNTRYKNDLALKVEPNVARYLDVILRPDNSNPTGYAAYNCKVSHTSGSTFDPSKWDLSSYTDAIYTSLVIAKNARIEFFSGNEIVMLDDNQNVSAGVTGGKYSFWAGRVVDAHGNLDIDKAPYRVTRTGKVYALSGFIGAFEITDGSLKMNHRAGNDKILGKLYLINGNTPSVLLNSYNNDANTTLSRYVSLYTSGENTIVTNGNIIINGDAGQIVIGMKNFTPNSPTATWRSLIKGNLPKRSELQNVGTVYYVKWDYRNNCLFLEQ